MKLFTRRKGQKIWMSLTMVGMGLGLLFCLFSIYSQGRLALNSVSPTIQSRKNQAHPLPQPEKKNPESLLTQFTSVVGKASNYLLKQQAQAGYWKDPGGRESVPFTALSLIALAGMPQTLQQNTIGFMGSLNRGVKYLIHHQGEDGSFINEDQQPQFKTYSTALSLLALTTLYTPAYQKATPAMEKAMKKARTFLEKSQFSEAQGVKKTDASYGGWGYGGKVKEEEEEGGKKEQEPTADMSNTTFAMDALHQAGVPKDNPVWKRVLTFISRCQNDSETNAMGIVADDGGFFYAPGGVSQAGKKKLANGKEAPISYGSMTYAGLMSFLDAYVTKSDSRVQAALRWIQHHYTLDENPNLRQPGEPLATQGLYYYYHTFAKALDAYGEKYIQTDQGKRYWAKDLLDKLAALQKEDGSWLNKNDRWWESYPLLATTYSLMALNHAYPWLSLTPPGPSPSKILKPSKE